MAYYILYKAKRKDSKWYIWGKYTDYQEAINMYDRCTKGESIHNYEFKTLMKKGD